MKHRNIQTIRTSWQGIAIRIGYEPNWLSMPGHSTAHLEIETIDPARAPLPVTETGYRSHFCTPDEVDALGGPLPFVLAWLDSEARSPKWKATKAAQRQLSLF